LSGVLVFHEPLYWYTMVGMALLFAGIMVLAYESKRGSVKK